MKTPKNIRLQLVYDDPDFQKEARAILDDFVVELKANNKAADYVENVRAGYIRSSAVQNYGSLALRNRYNETRKNYQLTPAEFTNFFTREEVMEEDGLKQIDQDSPIEFEMPTPEDKMLTVRIHPRITKEELLRKVDVILDVLDYQFNGGKKRLRGPANLELLWAIKKARIAKKSYKQIAKEVNGGSLPHYVRKHGEKIEWSETALKQYYYLYKKYVDKP